MSIHEYDHEAALDVQIGSTGNFVDLAVVCCWIRRLMRETIEPHDDAVNSRFAVVDDTQ